MTDDKHPNDDDNNYYPIRFSDEGKDVPVRSQSFLSSYNESHFVEEGELDDDGEAEDFDDDSEADDFDDDSEANDFDDDSEADNFDDDSEAEDFDDDSEADDFDDDSEADDFDDDSEAEDFDDDSEADDFDDDSEAEVIPEAYSDDHDEVSDVEHHDNVDEGDVDDLNNDDFEDESQGVTPSSALVIDEDGTVHRPQLAEKEEASFNDAVTYIHYWLNKLVHLMGLHDVKVEMDANEELKKVRFDIFTTPTDLNNLNNLIGYGKETERTIEAIQTLAISITEELSNDIRLEFDINNYLKSRAEAVEGIAHQLADLAVRLDRSITIAGFNSYERRITHNVLKNIDAVSTTSVGQGSSFRKICITPVK